MSRLETIRQHYERASVAASLAGFHFARAATALERGRLDDAEKDGQAALVALEEAVEAADVPMQEEWTAEEVLNREG